MNERKNISVIKDGCTGCSACMNICSRNAIRMEENIEGFKYPVIESERCIDCSMCIQICPVSKENNISEEPYCILKTFIAYAHNRKMREMGSSGGIFPLLCNSVFRERGCVYGAAFSSKEKKVKHILVDNSNYEQICRSKYVQSDVEYTFEEVKEKLEKGVKVLYSGTPCQISGLKSFLRKDYDNLFTVDFKCHGVPSPKIFKEMLMYYEKKMNSRIINCTFREKLSGWRNQNIIIYFENGKNLKCKSKYHYYYNLFIQNYDLRLSCYNCTQYRCHDSDITLADAWDEDARDIGASKIYINTQKGDEIFKRICNDLITQEINEKKEDLYKYKHEYPILKRKMFFKYYNRIKDHLFLFWIFNIKCFLTRIWGKFIR